MVTVLVPEDCGGCSEVTVNDVAGAPMPTVVTDGGTDIVAGAEVGGLSETVVTEAMATAAAC